MIEKSMSGHKAIQKIYESDHSLVYRTERETDHFPVILKILRDDYKSTEEYARYYNEYEIISSLDIDGVIKVYGLEMDHNSLVLQSEDIGGESLNRIIEHRTLDVPEFLDLAIKLADTLGKNHAAGVVHKDINPSNIVWNPQTGEVRIIDFGIAVLSPYENPALFNPTIIEGSLPYISPEQTGRVNRSLDYRTDLYSLGVTFYQMLTGRLPFYAVDEMGLVHSHIAVAPEPPESVNPDIPPVVSEIVMKLMSKTAEDRYQSAWGLKTDLDKCLQSFRNSGFVARFLIGQEDIPDRLWMGQKLYGREKQIEKIIRTIDRIGSDGSKLLLVSGYTGVGKTVLVQEVRRLVTSRNIYFIGGNFDESHRNVPYFGWVQALTGLMNQILMESERQLSDWNSKILEAVGSVGKVLTDVIPNLELVIGKQPDVPILESTEALNRFNFVFNSFIKSFTKKKHPLIIFLDNLQWVDSASLVLLDLLLSDRDVTHFLIIGAYRDNEVDITHPLMKTVKKLQERGVRTDDLKLENLSQNDVHQLMTEILVCDPSESNLISQLVHEKVEGNPFFLKQMIGSLYEEGLIVFDYIARRWQWDLAKIREKNITENVAELLVGKFNKLFENTQNILKLASCLGNRFEFEKLHILAAKTKPKTRRHLQHALSEGFVIQSDGGYQFAHDLIQQAVYSMIPESDRYVVHLRIGRMLVQNLNKQEIEKDIFNIVNHYNLGFERIDSQKEKTKLAELNLKAGKKAKAEMAYELAADYLSMGIELLGEDRWESEYDISFQLYKEAAEAEYLNGNFEKAIKITEIGIKKAITVLEQFKFYEIRIQIYNANNKLQEALDTGQFVLEMLGVSLVKSIQEKISIEELKKLHPMMDEEKIAAMAILMRIVWPAARYKPSLFAQITKTMISLCIRHGNSPSAAYGYAIYGFYLCGSLKDIEQGYLFGKLAFETMRKFSEISVKCKVDYIYNSGIRIWKEHTRQATDETAEAIQLGLEMGDIWFVGLHAKTFGSKRFDLIDETLESVYRKQREYIRLLKSLKLDSHALFATLWSQFFLNLMNKTDVKYALKDEIFNEKELLPKSRAVKYFSLLFNYNLIKTISSYLFGDFETAVSHAVKTSGYQESMTGLLGFTRHTFHYSLALLSHYQDVDDERKKSYLEKVDKNQEKMKIWAEHAPMNFQHQYDLVEAEKSRVLGKYWKAVELYKGAVQGAKHNGFLFHEALGCELAAKFYMTQNMDEFARIYLKKAHEGYIRWQAWAKVTDLEERYPHLLTQIDQKQATESKVIHSGLDFNSIIKAYQTISSEIDVDQLLKNLMKIVIENAGAQNGMLLLEKDGRWVMGAEADEEKAHVNMDSLKSIEGSAEVPHGVLNYVIKSRQKIILNDAIHEQDFIKDPYIRVKKVKSVLCIPLLNRGKLNGILYLENNLTTHAFTPDRIRILELLSSQAAISLENAIYYSQLNKEILERKQKEVELQTAFTEIQQLKDRLYAENIYLREEIEVRYKHEEIIGNSAAIKKVLNQIEQVAGTNSTVLIKGETGTGKELVARAIHRLSTRSDQSIVKVNCAALPSTLVESELFGHEKGAYTGAYKRQTGRFEIADGSTIFLDEISELPLDLQAKLLRVLQEGQFERLGSSKTIRVNVRVIAATNRDLSKALQKGSFREDLYYRLNVFPITVPPLRERREDIPLLVWSFVKEFGETMGKSIEKIPKKSMDILQSHSWPGNVRELRNIVERGMIISKGSTLKFELPEISKAKVIQDVALQDMEREHILSVLERTRWRVSGKNGAAKILGLHEATLRWRMKKLNIVRKS